MEKVRINSMVVLNWRIFDAPENRVRGIVFLELQARRGAKSIAHASLSLDKPAKVTTHFPSTLNLQEITAASQGMVAFSEKLRELETQAGLAAKEVL